MNYRELIDIFLGKVREIKREDPAYKQPGDGSGGVCDCIGLPIGSIGRMGLKWKGIHGSNYWARYQTVGLQYISSTSQLEPGDIVYKAVDSSGKVKKACNSGTITRKYDLPGRYFKGKQYYNGDLLDYYHAGVVTQVNPLQITHMTSPKMKVDTNLNGGWNYHGKAKPIVDAASDKEAICNGTGTAETKPGETGTTETKPTGVIATSGSRAIVVSDNGKPVKMRQYPGTSCRTWDNLPVGTEVEITEPGEDWAKINGGKRKGWYMMAKFMDVVGDGIGKY